MDLAYDSVVDDLVSNMPHILGDMGTYSAEKMAIAHGRAPDAFGIDLPMPFPMPELDIPVGKLPDTSLKGYLIFGAGAGTAKSGRVTGLEVQYDGNWQQVWRMDFHFPHPNSTDMDYWSSGPFHYHVLDIN